MTKSRTYSCRGRNSFSLLFVFLILVLAFTAGSAQADTFTVDSTYDDVDDSVDGLACYSALAGGCTLRAAIQEANFLAGDDIIMLSEGTYALSIGQLDINSNITIIGADNLSNTTDEGSIIDGNALDRVILVSSGTVNISKVTITNGNTAGFGGGIFNSGSLILSESTINDNASIFGAGIANNIASSMTLTNVTISGNTASGSAAGGIYNAGSMLITNVTIAENDAIAGSGGGIYTDVGADTTLKNTILDNNTSASDGNCGGGGTFISNGYNISSDATCVFLIKTGDWNSTDPLLDALADNGGATYTHALLAGSPAIDTGTMLGAPATDQRGVLRPQDGDGNETAVCDIGAFETGVLVFTPNGGELLEGGTAYTIQWTAPPGALYFTVRYSLNNGLKWKRLVKKTMGTSYSWVTPWPKKGSYTECLIKITAYSLYDGKKISEDISDSTFEIKSVDITSLEGGETVIPGGLGDPLRIEWDVYNTFDSVVSSTLSYSIRECGKKPKWILITELPGGMRSYNWALPGIAEDALCARVRIMLKGYRGKKLTIDMTPEFVIDAP